ncbi:MAG: T9SS type A sorting domain-containing protein [Saprospiraceae bacterium]|nr:T9SS type A sorting domain-containing protein [Saprospiraceae bacterium]
MKLKLKYMQKASIIILVIAGFVWLAAGRYSVSAPAMPRPLPPDTIVLNLPNEAFDYENIIIPEYILQAIDTSNAPFLPLLDSITDAGATLGRVLFYEKRLSANEAISCGSCHAQSASFGDVVNFSPGFAGVPTSRNTMHINHLAFSPGSDVFWDGRIQTVHEQVIMPILHPDEMGLTTPEILSRLEESGYYGPLFEAAFGDADISLPRVRSALVQFVASMAAFNSKFDQMQESGDLNVFSPIEQAGWVLFQESCVLCHIEGHFGTDSMFNIGLDLVYTDPGKAGWTGNPEDHGAFKSPTLRNIALAAPYMHDGRFANLEEVINFYSEEVQPHPNNHMAEMLGLPQPFQGFRYNDEQKAALLAFMHTLTDSTLLTGPKWSDPFVTVTAASEAAAFSDIQLRIFPNPAVHEAVAKWDMPGHDPAEITLRSLSGQLVYRSIAIGQSARIPLSGLPAGIYILEWKSGLVRHAARLAVR